LLSCSLLISRLLHRDSGRLIRWAGASIAIMDKISETLIEAVKWLALAMVLVTALLVIGRYVFGVGSIKGQESVIYMHALLFLLAGSATLVHDGHVRVDVLYSRMSKRQKAWIDLLGTFLLLIPVCLTILMFSESYVAMSWRVLEGSSEADGLHLVYGLKTAIPAFAVLMLLQGSAQALRATLTICDHPLPKAEPHMEPI